MSAVKLTFKDQETSNGNQIKVANFNGALIRMSKEEFTYQNGAGEPVSYHLATVSFKDNAGVLHTVENAVVYKTSVDKGMTVGSTYLGQIQRSTDVDGNPRVWITLSSQPAGVRSSELSFEDVEENVVANIGE